MGSRIKILYLNHGSTIGTRVGIGSYRTATLYIQGTRQEQSKVETRKYKNLDMVWSTPN